MNTDRLLAEFSTSRGNLKVVPEPAGTRGGYDDLRRATTREPIGKGLRVPVASTADLARMLAALGRESDVPKLLALRRLQALEPRSIGSSHPELQRRPYTQFGAATHPESTRGTDALSQVRLSHPDESPGNSSRSMTQYRKDASASPVLFTLRVLFTLGGETSSTSPRRFTRDSRILCASGSGSRCPMDCVSGDRRA